MAFVEILPINERIFFIKTVDTDEIKFFVF